MGHKNHVVDWVHIPMGRGDFERGKGQPIIKYRDYRPCVAAMQPFCQITVTMVIVSGSCCQLKNTNGK